MSVAADNNAALWNTLSYNVPNYHWRAVVNKEGWIATVNKIAKSGKVITKQLYTNAFKPTTLHTIVDETTSIPSSQDRIPRFTRELLEAKKVPDLRQICIQFNIKGDTLIIKKK